MKGGKIVWAKIFNNYNRNNNNNIIHSPIYFYLFFYSINSHAHATIQSMRGHNENIFITTISIQLSISQHLPVLTVISNHAKTKYNRTGTTKQYIHECTTCTTGVQRYDRRTTIQLAYCDTTGVQRTTTTTLTSPPPSTLRRCCAILFFARMAHKHAAFVTHVDIRVFFHHFLH